MLLAIYALTLAPGVTFWDAGEFITAAHVFGIPHPPGTPVYVAIGRAWTLAFGGVLGVARAMNLLSAVATATAGGVTAWMIARATRNTPDGYAGALCGALIAGTMMSVWANATETEVYAVALLHVALLMAAAYRAFSSAGAEGTRWELVTAYLIALAPAVHLMALVGAPAAVMLASRDSDGRWNRRRLAILAGATVFAIGVGRVSPALTTIGVCVILTAAVGRRREGDDASAFSALSLCVIAASALVILLLRARMNPPLDQGHPATWSALTDVIGRRQYDIAPLWPRRAPVWIQLASLAQYADWQAAMSWGNGIFTRAPRVLAMLAFAWLGGVGVRALRRDARVVCDALLMLSLCGTMGVIAYLNLRAGASIGYGFVPPDQHEARERDYFFVLGFWAWGVFAGYGALAVARARRWPALTALVACAIPLVGNSRVVDRRTGAEASAPRDVAIALLSSAPRNAVLFLVGDNDTYPVWYLQDVEGVRRDVTPVTIPLLGADWYARQVVERAHLSMPLVVNVDAPAIAQVAHAARRPVAVSTQLSAAERAQLGSDWRLEGAVYVAGGAANGSTEPPVIRPPGSLDRAVRALRARPERLPDDVTSLMLGSLDCWRLGRPEGSSKAARDSLEVRCNLR